MPAYLRYLGLLASPFQKRLTENSTLGEKKDVLCWLSFESPWPQCADYAVRVNSGPNEETGVKTLLATQVGRAGGLGGLGTAARAWCGRAAGHPHTPAEELQPQTGGMDFQPKTPQVAYVLTHRVVFSSSSNSWNPSAFKILFFLGLSMGGSSLLLFFSPPQLRWGQIVSQGLMVWNGIIISSSSAFSECEWSS